MLDLSAADALINTWNDKYHWNFWRPIIAIRQSRRRQPGNGRGPDLDAAVQSVGSRPGARSAAGGGVAAADHAAIPGSPVGRHRLRECQYGCPGVVLRHGRDDVLRHEQPVPGRAASFNRFSDLTNEVLEARIWAGIHFRNPTCRPRSSAVSRALHSQTPLRSRPLRTIIVERPFGVAPLWPTPRGQGRATGSR